MDMLPFVLIESGIRPQACVFPDVQIEKGIVAYIDHFTVGFKSVELLI